ncbi:hypothetical protein DP939_37225 [Spongiactinospora rosea]|uniref:Terpene synthase n=1 Tax=Spongiactinospora rosea TaxID=2248750 RepID=A0A366LMA2_9ACTN|nr:terpene synthase family protein [Spongiactinospora rosea]RBQ15048.1 hypothetical protein DP939_37225 [Spongiactinospora rosea]
MIAQHSRPEYAPPRPFPAGTRFYLRGVEPELHTAWHPHTAAWDACAREWADELLADVPDEDRSLLETVVRDGVWWACVCYPDAEESRMVDVLRAAIAHIVLDDCIYTSFLTDGRMGELLADFAAAMDDPAPDPSTFIGRFMAKTWREMSRRSPDGLKARLRRASSDYLRSTAIEVEARASGKNFTREEYLDMREGSMAADVVHFLGEYSIGIDMTEDMGRLPQMFDQVRRVGVAHFAYVNDLYTFRKEYCDGGDYQHSLVFTSVTHDGLTLQESIDRLCDLIEETEHLYRQVCDRILTSVEGEQRDRMIAYLRQIEYGLAGSREYSQTAARYHGRGFSHLNGNRFVPSRTSGWLELSPGKSIFHDTPA